MNLRLRPTAPPLLLLGLFACAAPPASDWVPAPTSRSAAGIAVSPASPGPPLGVPRYVIPAPAPPEPGFAQQAERAAPRLPAPGAPVFGSGGIAGTVTSNHGNFATVVPQGGGPPGILIPQGNGSTGLLSVPGRAPALVFTPH